MPVLLPTQAQGIFCHISLLARDPARGNRILNQYSSGGGGG